MLSIALFFIACEHNIDDPKNPLEPAPEPFECEELSRPEISDADILAAAQADTLFAMDIKEAVQEENSNLFISPFSITSALGLLHLGANGISDQEMQSTLYMSDAESWHAGKGLLTQELHQPERCDYQLAIANRVFGQSGYSILDDYLGATESIYGAPLQEVDFASDPEAGREVVNQWVSDQTMTHIPELFPVGSISSNTKLVLANAVYMNAPWKHTFDPDNTRPMPFTTESGELIETDMMYDGAMPVRSYQDDLLTMATFSYEGDELSMTVYVPQEGHSLIELEETLGAEEIAELQGRQSRGEKMVYFPKFELKSKLMLNEPLIKLGMASLFDPETSDLSGINGIGGLYVSTVIHEAWLKVDEAGTKAAAATGISVEDTAMDIDYIINLNRAFMFTIQDELSGNILFMGRVADPSQE